MLQKIIIIACSFCSTVATIWILYLAFTSHNPIPTSTIHYIAMLVACSVVGNVLEHVEIKWSWNSRYFKNGVTDDDSK